MNEKKLRQIVEESIGFRKIDVMIMGAYSTARGRGYMVRGTLNPLVTGMDGVGDVEVFHLADPTRGRRYDVISKTDYDEKIKFLETKEAIEKHLDYSSSNTTIDDLAEAIHNLSSFLRGSYEIVCLSRFFKPERNINFDTCAWDLIRCYEHMARAYLRLLPTENKEGLSK